MHAAVRGGEWAGADLQDMQDFASLRLVLGWLSLLSLSFFLFLASSRGGPSAGVAPVSRGSRHDGRSWIEQDRVADLHFFFSSTRPTSFSMCLMVLSTLSGKYTSCKNSTLKRGVEIDAHPLSVSRGTAGSHLGRKASHRNARRQSHRLCQLTNDASVFSPCGAMRRCGDGEDCQTLFLISLPSHPHLLNISSTSR